MTEKESETIFEQLARQKDQHHNAVKVIVHPVSDENFMATYGMKTKAIVTIVVPESEAQEIVDKYQ